MREINDTAVVQIIAVNKRIDELKSFNPGK